jgi:hypothetical protein
MGKEQNAGFLFAGFGFARQNFLSCRERADFYSKLPKAKRNSYKYYTHYKGS